MYYSNIHWIINIFTQFLKLIYRTVTKIIHINDLWGKKKSYFLPMIIDLFSETNRVLQSQKMEKNQRDIKIYVNTLNSKNYCIYRAASVRTTSALVFCKYCNWYQSAFCHCYHLCLAISGWYSVISFFL